MAAFRFAPVTKARWPDFEKLFEAKGGPSYCWCMAWRDMPNRQNATNAERKAAMSAFVADGTPVGLLGYIGDEVAGWCSVAPRDTLRKLSPKQDDEEKGVWAVVCFFVARQHRKSGLASALLDATIEYAFREGAKSIEAYPVDPDSPSYRFMGFKKMFAERGFRETGMAGSRRHVMRLDRAWKAAGSAKLENGH
jgi:GNAT superfamily N-acetyltransferase